jgi:hypothetical protein
MERAEFETIVSECPPYANELENCIIRCPFEGGHHVMINFTNTFQVEFAPGKYKWTDKDHVSEYKMKNVVFSNIEYDVQEPDEFQEQTLWRWLHALVFGPPAVQAVVVSFNVRQSPDPVSESTSARV